jgi:hypothetical protein
MRRRMFSATINFFDEYSRVNDFAQICAASVWTMRWQVKGFFAEAGFYDTPSIRPKESELRSRFLAGSGLNGANFRTLVDGQTWADQSSILAEMVLLAFISIFEGWSDALGDEVGITREQREALQWPSYSVYPRRNNFGAPRPGIDAAISAGRLNISAIMSTCFYPVYKNDRKYSLGQLDELMICYRYWKEVRNALAHSGGRATSRLMSEDGRLTPLSPSSMGVNRIPRINGLVLDEQVSVELYDVLGLGDVLHRIAVTVDAELSETDKAELIMLARLAFLRRGANYRDPPLSPVRRQLRIRDWMIRAGMASPNDLPALDAFLTDRYGVLLRTPR